MSDDTGERRPALLLRGIFAAAAAGAMVGLVDGLLSLRAGNQVVRPDDLPLVVGFYAGVFAPCGIVAALVARWFAWSHRALGLLIGLGAAFFLIAAYANVELLPDFRSPLSIGVDVVLLIVAIVWFRRSYFGTGEDIPRSGRWFVKGAFAVGVAYLAAALSGVAADEPVVASHGDDSERPNVLVVLVDTLRADHLGCYGYDKPTSPEIDAFAKDAVVFEDARAPTSWTKPSVASLFTSLYPSAHACIQQKEILVPEAETLAEIFSAAGYRTGAFSDNPFISPEFGFGQGFDHFDRARPSVVANGTLLGKVLFMARLLSLSGEPLGVGEKLYRGADTLLDGEEGFFAFLDAEPWDGDNPWFAYVHAMEPHLPYDPLREDATAFGYPAGDDFTAPPAYNGALPFQKAPEPGPGVREKLMAQYDAEIRGVSRAFGRLLDGLRERDSYENTLIVFLSDHGEEFHEHGGWTHGHSLHREVVWVPLIVRVPDMLGGTDHRKRRVDDACSLLDVFPTLLDLCQVSYPAFDDHPLRGQSLVRALVEVEDEKPLDSLDVNRGLLGEVSSGPVELRSLKQGRWLYVRANSPMQKAAALYDSVADPGETRDRAEKRNLVARDMNDRLAKTLKVLEKHALVGGARELDRETSSLLEGLGYK